MVKLRKRNEPLDGQLALAELIHAIRDLTAVEDLGDIRLREVVALAQFLQPSRPDAGVLAPRFPISLRLTLLHIDAPPVRICTLCTHSMYIHIVNRPLLKTYKKPYFVDEKLTFMFRSSFITSVFAIQKDKLLAFDIMLRRL